MIPISSTIKGFGPYRDPTTINWTTLPSPAAILAQFGTGKTWLIEAGILFPLFGKGGWYAGSIYDALTQGGNGHAVISLTFDHQGQRYIAKRTIKATGKTKSHRAVLTRTDTGEMIAGPKVGDFDRAIAAMIGDHDTAVATWLLAQNRAGDLCGQPGDPDLAARRRDVFHRLLGADVLDALEQRVAERARTDRTVAETLEAQLDSDGRFDEAIVEEQTQLASKRARLAQERELLAKAEEGLEAARAAARAAEGADGVLQAHINEHDRALAAAGDLNDRVDELMAEVGDLNDRAAGLDAARTAASGLEMYKGKREQLRDQLADYDRRQAWERRRDEIEAQVNGLKENIATIEAVPGADDDTRALAARVDELRTQYREATSENKAIEERNALLEIDRRATLHNLADAKAHIADIDARVDAKPETPGGAVCDACPLLEEFSALPGKRQDWQTRLESYEIGLSEISADAPLIETADLIAEGERAAGAAETVAKATGTAQMLRATGRNLEQAEAELADHATRSSPSPDDPREALQAVQADLDVLAGAPERVGICEQASLDAQAKQANLDDVQGSLIRAREEAEGTREQADSARAALADREQQRESLRLAVSAGEQTVATHRATIEELTRSIAAAETRLEELQRRQAEQAEKAGRVRALRDNLEGLADLRQCLGPRGVRQILIDDAVPDLEDIAADLFARATDGRQQLRIATQHANIDGSTAEAFDILVRDERGERDVTRFSGGQLQLIQILFRIAVAIWVGRMRGQKADLLILDEAFDRLGAEGTEDLLRVLEHLGDSISLIVVVTHDPQIAARMRSQLRLTSTFSGVQIETMGAAA